MCRRLKLLALPGCDREYALQLCDNLSERVCLAPKGQLGRFRVELSKHILSGEPAADSLPFRADDSISEPMVRTRLQPPFFQPLIKVFKVISESRGPK